MEKKLVAAVIVAICVVGAVGGALAYQAVSAPMVPETKTPMVASDPFNVVFRWGCGGAKNELNTYNGSFTKDLIMNGTATTTLILSEEELDKLQQKIVEINLFSYPESYPKTPGCTVFPQSDCYLTVQNGEETKEIFWNSNSEPDSLVVSRNHLQDYIIWLIEQTPEYQALPEAFGG